MRDDTNERDALLNHAHHGEPPDTPADLPAELLPTHEALTQLAEAWSATIPSAERLTAFTRQIPTQAPTREKSRPTAPLRERARRKADDAHPAPGRGRLLAGLAAAVVIVGLLSATLLRLSAGRTGRHTQPLPTAVATPSLTARAAEEPSQQPPSARWATVAHAAQILPAPSDGNTVYLVKGNAASVSTDGGATWRALALPPLSQTQVGAEYISLAVSAADPHVVLLTIQLNLTSANPADCPAGSTPALPIALHGGILASGAITCWATFMSQDSGAEWTASHGLTGPFTTPIMWQSADTLYGLVDDTDRKFAPKFPLVGYRLMVSQDRGATWSEQHGMATLSSRFLCSVMPSPGDNALYAVTATAPCFSGTEGAQSVMRSVDGGASWRQVSTVDAFSATLLAASPTPSGHGAWLYMMRQRKGSTPVTPVTTLLASVDGGASWQDIPQPPQIGASTLLRPIADTLSDGSLVIASVVQTSGAYPPQIPTKTAFYAWRPGDSAWRQLATSLTAYYDYNFLDTSSMLVARGGQHAVDTLWYVEAPTPYQPNNDIAHAYPIR